jgi:hypothetical protein
VVAVCPVVDEEGCSVVVVLSGVVVEAAGMEGCVDVVEVGSVVDVDG